MSKPITSRIKRSPLLKYSPLKNDNEEAIGTKTTKGEDKVEIKKTEKKKNYPTDQQVCHPDYKAKTGKGGPGSKECDAWKNTSDEQKKKAETEVVEEKVVTPGEDKKVDVTLKRTQEQDVMQPWEVRQQNRATKVASRNVGKAEKRLERMRKRGLEGTERFKAAEARLETAKSTQARVNEGAGSGYKAGTRIKRKEDRAATTGEFTDPEQVKMGARRQEIADQAGLTVDQGPKAIEPGSNPFANMDAAKGLTTLDYEVGQYYTPFQSKKSPLKKALKGDQYKLPKHLQNAIKAAPGKLKTPLKKGYFKNK